MILLAAAAAAAVPLAAAVLGSGAPETPAAPGDFVTVWETTLPGESVTFPGLGTYTIDWGDGAVGANVTGPQTHAYAAAGSHAVSVSGLSRIFGDCQTGAQKLKSIEQWGNASWTGMHRAFCGASHMTYNAPDAPDLSRVTDMSGMFLGAAAFDGDLSGWDVSQVTDMDGMFNGADSFRQNLGNWYVVPAGTSYSSSEGTLNATTVSAQNPVLDGHSPEYGIGSGGDSGLFEMAGNALVFRDAPSARGHAVNVTASGRVFEDGNNWRMLEITVTGGDPPTILPAGDGAASWRFAAPGAASDGAAAFRPAATVTARDAPMTASPAAYPRDAEARAARIGIIDAPGATPAPVDPEPGMVDSTAAPDTVDPDPMEDQDSAGRALPAIRMWPSFEPESITNADLSASLGLDYPGLDVPNWVMMELGPLVAKGDVTAGEFRTALEYATECVTGYATECVTGYAMGVRA